MSKYFVKNNGFMYDARGNITMATTINENGADLVFFTNEEDALDMFEVEQPYDLFEELDNSQLTFELRVFDSEVVNEATCIKVPLNSEKDFKGLNMNERREKIDKVPHVKLWISPDNLPTDYSKYAVCWVWVELPKEQEGIKYVPIILHTSGGVSIHPYYHKYFLRAFDKRTRHLILGFCYVYGHLLVSACNYSRGKSEISPMTVTGIELYSLYYKDSEAPKRINAGPKPNDKFFKPSVEDYDRWLKSL